MVTVKNVDDKYFTLDGIRFAKIYQPLKQGLNNIGIYSIYDTKHQLVNSTIYSEFTIDGAVYASQAEAITALLFVIWSGVSDYDIEQLNIRVDNLELNQYTGVVVYSTLAELPATGTLLVSYKVANDPLSSNNGYYHWNGSSYTKDASLANGVIESGNEDPVSGETVYVSEGKIKSNIISNEFVNLININTLSEGFFVLGTTGGLIANSSYNSSDYIPVNEGEEYTKDTAPHYAFYDSGKSYLSGETTGGTQTFIVPTGAVYVRVSSSTVNFPMLNKGSSLLSYRDKVLDGIKESQLSIDERVFNKINVLDFDVKLNYRGQSQLGGTISKQSTSVPGLIGKELVIEATAASQGGKILITKELTSVKTGDYIQAALIIDDLELIDPAKYSVFGLRIIANTTFYLKPSKNNFYYVGDGVIDKWLVLFEYIITDDDVLSGVTVDGFYAIATSPKTFTFSFPIFMLNESKVDIIKHISLIRFLLQEMEDRRWTGKKWQQLGDSVTALSASGDGFLPYVLDKNKFYDYTLNGVGGSDVGGSGSNSFWQDVRVNTIDNDCDLVTILGGINDFAHNIPLGTSDSIDTNTFAGGLNTLFDKLFTKNKSYRLAFIAPYYIDYPTTTNSTNLIGNELLDYVLMAKDVCLRWGVPFCNLHLLSNFNKLNKDIKTQDTVHPSLEGWENIGKIIADFIDGL